MNTNRTEELLEALTRRLDDHNALLEDLARAEARRRDLYDEAVPIVRIAMDAIGNELAKAEQDGLVDVAKAWLGVGRRLGAHLTVRDVEALGDAIVTMVETFRAVTQPEVLAVVGEAAEGVGQAEGAEPLGVTGLLREARDEDVQRGMAVMVSVLKHVGKAAQAISHSTDAPARRDRRDRLRAQLGPRRAQGPSRFARARDEVAPAPAPAPNATAPSASPKAPPTQIDGVELGPDGHLVDAATWSREVAVGLGQASGVQLGDAHWAIVDAARADFLQTGQAPNVRRLSSIANVATRDLYELFPKAPARTVARIAGLPKPAGCI